MRNLITGADVFNELRMLRKVFPGALFVMEGSSDCGVLDNFVDPASCRTIPAHCKDNVLEAIELSERTSLRGVLGLVDADFDRFRKRLPASQNVCVTDLHDMDLTILLSGVFHRTIPKYYDGVKHEAFLKADGRDTLLDVILDCAAGIGALRWISESQRLDLNFQALSFATFVDTNTLWLNQSELIRTVAGNTRNCRASLGSVAADIVKVRGSKPDPTQIVSGHDVVELISIALRFTVADCPTSVADTRSVERLYRKEFTTSDFQTTHIYRWIGAWESRNQPYRVLRG